MARVREFWIYQRRNVREPWALQIVVEFDRRKKMPYSHRWDVIVYGDWIPRTHHDSSIYQRTFKDGEEFAFAVSEVLSKYGIMTEVEDMNQLFNAWIDIIIGC